MEYEDINDSELVSMINEVEDAKDILFQKYKYIIDIVIKNYTNMAIRLGIELSDLYQEAMVGFVDGLNCYRDDKDASLPRFITVCVERKLQSAIIKAGRIKNKILNDSLSLEHTYDAYKQPLMDILSDNSNPLDNIISEESVRTLISNIKGELSEAEYEVFELMISGLSYQEIATILGKNTKQVDNTIQRIKGKIKAILKEE